MYLYVIKHFTFLFVDMSIKNLRLATQFFFYAQLISFTISFFGFILFILEA